MAQGAAGDPWAHIEVLACLDPAARRRLATACRLHRFAPGELVLAHDEDTEDSASDVLLVIEGAVRVVDRTPGGRAVTFAEIGAGGHVGELAALDGGPRTASVEAIDHGLAAVLPAAALHDLLEEHPCVAVAMLRDLVRIIRNADLRISELSTLGAVERLCRELLRRARPIDSLGSALVVDPLPTQEQLASTTGATRETVARLLGQLRAAGLVRRAGVRLILLDPARLIRMAG